MYNIDISYLLLTLINMNSETSENRTTRGRGRPTLLSPCVAKVLLDAIEKGIPYRLSAALAGISYDTLNRWIKEGQKEEARPEYRDFYNQLEASKGRSVDFLVGIINDAAIQKKDWKAAAWMLTRRYPKDFGPAAKGDYKKSILDEVEF